MKKKSMIIMLCLSMMSAHGYLKYYEKQLRLGKTTNFSGADIRGLPFSKIQGVSLKGANFHNVRGNVCIPTVTNARAHGMVCDPDAKTDFSGLDLTGADLSSSNFGQAQFVKANLAGVNLQYSSFRFADLSGAHFEGARIGATDFTGANLKGATGFEKIVQSDGKSVFTCAIMPDGTVCTPDIKTWTPKNALGKPVTDASGAVVSIPCNCLPTKGNPKKYCMSGEFKDSLNILKVTEQAASAQNSSTNISAQKTNTAPVQTVKK